MRMLGIYCIKIYSFSKSLYNKNKVNLLFLILVLHLLFIIFSLDRFELVQNAKSKFLMINRDLNKDEDK